MSKKKFYSIPVIIISLLLALSYLPGTLESTVHTEDPPKEDNEQVKVDKPSEPADEQQNDPLDPEKIVAMVKPAVVKAKITADTDVYNNYNSQQVIGQLSEGDKVEIVKDKGYQWYYVKSNNLTGWVPYKVLSIPSDPNTNDDEMTTEQVEAFANIKGFESDTNYLVWVDINRQLTHILTGKKENWKLAKTMPSATGKNVSPTLRGTFTIKERGNWFYSPQFESGAKYWVRYDGAYLFHTVAMDKNQKVKDPTLGERASSGCIRLAVENAKWIYNNIPSGTKVFVN
ncbi:MAG: hypothetical protein FH758_14195 [Firmicutes bacterium]|nr:hypothetical protein [Bacillota bacterium]